MVKQSAPKEKKKPAKKKPAVTVREKRKQQKASAEKLKMLTRQTWAIDLKRQGLSYRRIARRLKELKVANDNYDSGLAYRDVQEAMNRLIIEQKEIAEVNLTLDLQRIEELMMVAYPLAVPDEETMRPPDFQAVGVVMMLIDKREKLLNYKALWAQPDKPQWNINVDWSKFSTQEILEIRRRIESGEEPLAVFTEIQQKANPTDGTPSP